MGFNALNFVIELVLFFLFVIILIVLARKNKIIPIEVKSSGYKTHKSLDVFTEKY